MKKARLYKKWQNRFLKAVESTENKHEPCTFTYFKRYRPVKGKHANFLWDKLQPESPFYDKPKFNKNRKYYFVDTLQGFTAKRESGIRVKTPAKLIKNYRYILSIVDNMEGLLYFKQPLAHYTQKGWTCDFYDINGILLCVGDSPISCKNTCSNANIIVAYDTMAWDIINDVSIPTGEQQEQINNLLAGFLEMCKL